VWSERSTQEGAQVVRKHHDVEPAPWPEVPAEVRWLGYDSADTFVMPRSFMFVHEYLDGATTMQIRYVTGPRFYLNRCPEKLS